ncbi:MAG: hypothetical protein WD066_07230 [Planctomycetaceae bacterium]
MQVVSGALKVGIAAVSLMVSAVAKTAKCSTSPERGTFRRQPL